MSRNPIALLSMSYFGIQLPILCASVESVTDICMPKTVPQHGTAHGSGESISTLLFPFSPTYNAFPRKASIESTKLHLLERALVAFSCDLPMNQVNLGPRYSLPSRRDMTLSIANLTQIGNCENERGNSIW